MHELEYMQFRGLLNNEASLGLHSVYLEQIKTLTILKSLKADYYGVRTYIHIHRPYNTDNERVANKLHTTKFLDEFYQMVEVKARHKFPNLEMSPEPLDQFKNAILSQVEKCYLGMQPYGYYLGITTGPVDLSKFILFEPFCFIKKNGQGKFVVSYYCEIKACELDSENQSQTVKTFKTIS